MDETPTFLLVHGSWHGPWCWEALVPALARRGFRARTVALPSCGDAPERLGTFADDAAAVSRAAAATAGDVIVVGHSYGGAAITEATYGNVGRLVYLAAFMPDTGRSYVSYLPPGPLPPYVRLNGDGTFSVPDGQAIPHFYADCTPRVAGWAMSLLRLQSQQVMKPGITDAAWRHLPSTYIVTTQDRALPPDFQRMFAAQATDIREFESSHSPFLSRPDALAELLISIAG